jgi:hypothetical protein
VVCGGEGGGADDFVGDAVLVGFADAVTVLVTVVSGSPSGVGVLKVVVTVTVV